MYPPTKRHKILEKIISHRKGWGPNGEIDKDTIKKVAVLYVQNVSRANASTSILSSPFPLSLEGTPSEKLPVLEYHPLLSEIANEADLELVRVRFWTAENTGLGSWRGPPFVTNYKQHCLAFDVKTGAEVSSEFQTIGFSIPRN